MSDFQPGDALRIHRPGRKDHGHHARFVEPGQDPAFAWVAFHKEDSSRLPTVADLRNPSKCPRKLYPLSHLRPDDAH